MAVEQSGAVRHRRRARGLVELLWKKTTEMMSAMGTSIVKGWAGVALLLVAWVWLASPSLAQSADGPRPSSLSETYSDWRVNCIRDASDETGQRQSCEMVQELTQRDSGRRFLAISIRPQEQGALVTFVAPFGLLLSDGIGVSIVEDEVFKVQFRTCLPLGCVGSAFIPITSIAALAAGDVADVKMTGTGAAPGSELRDVNVSISLIGFTAAWNRVKTINR